VRMDRLWSGSIWRWMWEFRCGSVDSYGWGVGGWIINYLNFTGAELLRTSVGAVLDSDCRVLIRAKNKADVWDLYRGGRSDNPIAVYAPLLRTEPAHTLFIPPPPPHSVP
jgi:hypothetical protein